MLRPSQIAILANLVHNAIKKYPLEALSDDQKSNLTVKEPWEKELEVQINASSNLPNYGEFADEDQGLLDVLIDYFAE